MIHPLADCQCSNIPENTCVWQFCVIFPKATIGENCNICSHCIVENGAIIGKNGIELEDNVFIGANVTFTNDMYPRSHNTNWVLQKTLVCKGASIGAGSTLLPGLTIGENAMIGAGSMVTKNIPAGEVWVGNPAHFVKKVGDV